MHDIDLYYISLMLFVLRLFPFYTTNSRFIPWIIGPYVLGVASLNLFSYFKIGIIPKAVKKNNSFENQKKVKSLKNRISTTESKIADLEKEIKTIDHNLLMNYDETIAENNFFDMYQAKKDTLEKLMTEWEKLTNELETIAL